MGGVCDTNQAPKLEMIASYNQNLQVNLGNNKVQAPRPHQAIKSNGSPKLNENIEKILNNLLQESQVIQKQSQGIEFPTYYLMKQKVYYHGEWKKRVPNGKGKVYMRDGTYFQGYFKNGQAQCKDGIFIYPDGSYYRGNIKQSNLDGQGIFYYFNGMIYNGFWKKGRPHGHGKEIFPDKSQYQGEFYHGKKQGQGIFRWNNGKQYQGQFEGGYLNGTGTLKMGQNGYFQGNFYRNMKQGEGEMKTAYGTYRGPFVKGQMQGQGLFTWNDGKIYQGEFKNGKLHGKGTITYPNGQKVTGDWIDGQNQNLDKVSKQ